MDDHSQTESSSVKAYRSTRGDGAGVATAPLHSGPAKGSESTRGGLGWEGVRPSHHTAGRTSVLSSTDSMSATTISAGNARSFRPEDDPWGRSYGSTTETAANMSSWDAGGGPPQQPGGLLAPFLDTPQWQQHQQAKAQGGIHPSSMMATHGAPVYGRDGRSLRGDDGHDGYGRSVPMGANQPGWHGAPMKGPSSSAHGVVNMPPPPPSQMHPPLHLGQELWPSLADASPMSRPQSGLGGPYGRAASSMGHHSLGGGSMDHISRGGLHGGNTYVPDASAIAAAASRARPSRPTQQVNMYDLLMASANPGVGGWAPHGSRVAQPQQPLHVDRAGTRGGAAMQVPGPGWQQMPHYFPRGAVAGGGGALRRGDSGGLMRGPMMDPDGQSQMRRGKESLGPKRKKLTTLKKKILMNRLQQYTNRMMVMAGSGEGEQTGSLLHAHLSASSLLDRSQHYQSDDAGRGGDEGEQETSVLCFLDYVNQELLEDEEEIRELSSNITDLCSAFGKVLNVRVPRAGEEDVGIVFVYFETPAQARKAVEQLQRKVVGGEELNVALYPTDGWGAENLRRGLDHAIIGDGSMDDSSSSCGRQASAMNSAMVWFHSFAEPECLVDDDEYEEVVSDVQGLSSRYGMVITVKVFRVDEGQAKGGDAMVEFARPAEAQAAVTGLSGLPLQGQALRVTLGGPHELEEGEENGTKKRKLWGVLLREACAEGSEEVKRDVVQLCSLHGRVLGSGMRAGTQDFLVQFGTELEAKSAAAALDGREVRGRVLSASVQPFFATIKSTPKGPGESCTIVLESYVDPALLVDEEEVEEIVANVTELCRSFGTIDWLRVNRGGSAVAGRGVGSVLVRYNSPTAAQDAVRGLTRKSVGGQPLQIALMQQDDELGSGQDQHQPSSSPTTSQAPILQARGQASGSASSSPKVGPSGANQQPPQQASQNNPLSHLSPYAQAYVPPGASQQRPGKGEGDELGFSITSDSDGLTVMMNGGGRRLPPKYAKAAAVPKLRGNAATPLLPASAVGTAGQTGMLLHPGLMEPNGGMGMLMEGVVGAPPPIHMTTDRDDVVMCTPELEELIKELIKTLMQFQERARLRDSIKAKKVRRMVFGLREVMRGIRTNKIKFVIIAPDIERSPALDEEISEILQLAATNEIPVVFGMSGRRLGKCLGKSVRITVVGILSAEGAFDAFREVVRQATCLADDYARRKQQGVNGIMSNGHTTSAPQLQAQAQQHFLPPSMQQPSQQPPQYYPQDHHATALFHQHPPQQQQLQPHASMSGYQYHQQQPQRVMHGSGGMVGMDGAALMHHQQQPQQPQQFYHHLHHGHGAGMAPSQTRSIDEALDMTAEALGRTVLR